MEGEGALLVKSSPGTGWGGGGGGGGKSFPKIPSQHKHTYTQ